MKQKGATVSGLGALGSAATMFPHPLARIGGSAVGMAAPAINAAIDWARAPAEPKSVMQGYADGGSILPIQGIKAAKIVKSKK